LYDLNHNNILTGQQCTVAEQQCCHQVTDSYWLLQLVVKMVNETLWLQSAAAPAEIQHTTTLLIIINN